MKYERAEMKDCPSPENPCMCLCHIEEQECMECRAGRHKPKNQRDSKIGHQQQPMPVPEPIDGMLRSVAAIEHVTGGITPIAIEKFESGKWTRLGYDGGSRIISLDEWKAGPQP